MHNLNFPPEIQCRLRSYDWHKDSMGRSASDIFMLTQNGDLKLVLKVEQDGPFAELSDEAKRLEWLTERGVLCPEVQWFEQYEGRQWLLLTALSGTDLVSDPELLPLQQVEILADALRHLHTLDWEGCPYDQTVELGLREAEARMKAGLVNEDDFDPEWQGEPAQKLFSYLTANIPEVHEKVLCHGDACLPNFMATAGDFSGYLDCSRVGLADRYQDLALAVRSIRYNHDDAAVEHFLKCYGIEQFDKKRATFFTTLDEFF
ncbi:Aminoglycoside 3'-phosphotransferase [Pseudovibrio sp. FO-BEG1]|uniref:APH(3') family aminoglycoside O-phosphotransferase n=1 Tax=Pseudovibrio sp. (strain FO-BEG1) TaxID=911045 RepID=UPI000238D56E|nr:APH(3') family aminoglycoside O-phosphotransferase [Pseudovibrio sp. FO-BEG1]AEV38766.1 Aminoglycoside 3'-phosphotransferase [Pseudovibrio sp. FO-BEG1]